MSTIEVKSEYDIQAETFLQDTGTSFEAVFVEYALHFDSDKVKRDIYDITLKKGERSYTFRFGQSIADSSGWWDRSTKKIVPEEKAIQYELTSKPWLKRKGKEPTAYDVLACLTKYDCGTLEDFCSDFGYSADSISANKIYKAVKDEHLNVCRLFTEAEIEILQEIS